MDKFPEAFRRFEQQVSTRQIKTFPQLTLAFANWAGSKWRDTSKQLDALAVQAGKLRIPVKDYYMREQQRHQWDRAIMTGTEERMFSKKYSSYQQWQSKTVRTTAYQRRISNYMWNHPNASLAEARGHGKNQQWQSKTVRTTAYQRRISNYMRNHPNASLQQARGHGKKGR